MNRSAPVSILGFFTVGLAALSTSFAESPTPAVALRETPLDAYVKAEDTTFSYKIEKTLKEATHTTYIVRMQSQTWLTTAEVDRVVWEHDLKVVVPSKVTSSVGLMFIGGGANGRAVPDKVGDEFVKIALGTGSVVTELGQVPNQTLRFVSDPDNRDRTEDALIAFGWRKFLEGGEVKWLARLPMTKSVVRAMDAVTAICQEQAKADVTQFVVAGASKRGWTTWTTGAVDKRVKAIIPIVIDMLNVVPSFQHHFQAYGFFAPAVDDYVNEGIMEWQNTKRYAELIKLVEPYEYRDRYTMPKLLINAVGDQFFLPDSSQFYFNDLPGEKYLRYVPNVGHSLKGSDAWETLFAYYAMLLADKPRPTFAWKANGDETLVVTPTDKPAEVRLWQATNPKARDFRKDTLGPVWTSEVLQANAAGEFVGTVPKPAEGWTAFMVELTYPTPAKVPLKFTTDVHVTPTTLPFPPFKPSKTD